jgi:hypothetical protein
VKDRLLVGSTYKSGWFVGPLALAGVFMLLDVFLGKSTRGALTILGFVFMLVASASWAAIFIRRRWLAIEPEGFEVDGPGFRQVWRDLEVANLAWSSKRNYSNGLPKSETCSLTVSDAGGRRVTLTHERALKGASEFVNLAGRLFEGLCVRVREQLNRGGELAGEGWRLGRESLSFKEGRIAVADVSAVAEFDGQLRVWRKGSNDAAFGIGAGTLNASLLRRFLDELRPKLEAAAVDSGDDLGNVLFERKGSSRTLFWYLFGGLVASVAVPALAASPGWGSGFLGLGLGIVVWGWWLGGLLLRCHDRGVSRRTRRGTTTIRYRDMEEFSYQATRHFVNGAYTGTTMLLQFVSRQELGREKIRWAASQHGMDQEMEALRDHISKVMAMRWIEDLKAGKAVDWTPNLRLWPDGVEFRPGGLLGRKDWVKAPYGTVAGSKIESGVCYLFLKGEAKSSVSEPVSAPNFFPGYYVLLLALQSASGN